MSNSSVLSHILTQYQHDAKRHKTRRYKSPYKTTKSGSIVGTINPKTSTGSTHSGGGLLGVLGNLGTDVKDTVTGFPAGILQTIHHPIGTAKAIAADYKYRYSPLVSGNFGEFAHRVGQHPLSYLLDAATVASAGGGAIAKAASTDRVATAAAEGSRVAKAISKAGTASELKIAPYRGAAKADKTISVPLQANPVKRARTRLGVKLQEQLPTNTPLVGIKARAEKVAKMEHIKTGAESRRYQRAYNRVLKRKGVAEDHALHAAVDNVARGVTAKERIGLLQEHLLSDANPDKKFFLRQHGADAAPTFNKGVAHVKPVTEKVTMSHVTDAAKQGDVQAFRIVENLRKSKDKTLPRLERASAKQIFNKEFSSFSKRIGEGKRLSINNGDLKIAGADIVRSTRATDNGSVSTLTAVGKDGTVHGSIQFHRVEKNGSTVIRELEGSAANQKKFVDQMLSEIGDGTINLGKNLSDEAKQIVTQKATAAGRIQKGSRLRVNRTPTYKAATDRYIREVVEPQLADLKKKVNDKEVNSLASAIKLRHQYEETLRQGAQAAEGGNKAAVAMAKKKADALIKDAGETGKLAMTDRAKNGLDLYQAHAALGEDAASKLVGAGVITREEADQRAVLHRTMADALAGRERSPEQIKADFEKVGMPVPVFSPDPLTLGSLTSRNIAKENKGILYRKGRNVQNPQSIVFNNEIASKLHDYRNAQDILADLGKEIKDPKDLPKDWVYINKRSKTMEELNKLNEQQLSGKPLNTEDFWKNISTEKWSQGAIAVPKSLRDELIGMHGHMATTRSNIVAQAVKAWKYLTLATRPAFAFNNVVSNQIMFWMKNGWGARAVKNAGRYKDLYDTYFHEHREGTFGATERVKSEGPVAKVANSMYKLVGAHEDMLRRQTFYETARKLPQVRAEMRRLKGGTFDPAAHGGKDMFEVAFESAVEKSRAAERAGTGIDITKLIGKNIDDTLGNYRYYSAMERNIKNVIPFYGWNRHSVRASVRLIEDNPAIAAMAVAIGAEGHKKSLKDLGPGLPEFMQTYVRDSYIKDLGDMFGLNTDTMDFAQLNPYLTAVQTGQALGGNKQAAAGALGPTITGPLEYITGKSLLTGAPARQAKILPGPLGILENVTAQTPPFRLGEALTSNSNEAKKMLPSSDREQIVRMLGPAFRSPNWDVARQNEARNQAEKRKKKKTNQIIGR